MDSWAIWLRLKTHRWVYSFSIAITLALGILIGTVVSSGVKGKEGQKSADATPLAVPSPKQLSNVFSEIAKELGPCVVNINTESTIKNPHRRGGQSPDDDDSGGNGGMMTFSTGSLAGRADRGWANRVRCASVHW